MGMNKNPLIKYFYDKIYDGKEKDFAGCEAQVQFTSRTRKLCTRKLSSFLGVDIFKQVTEITRQVSKRKTQSAMLVSHKK